MPAPRDMVALIENALAETPVGVVSVAIDGQTTQWNRAQALAELVFWRRRAAAATRASLPAAARFGGVDISGAGR